MTLMLISAAVALASAIGLVICYFNMWTEDWAGYLLPVCLFFLVAGLACFLIVSGAYFSHPHVFHVGWGWIE